MKQNQDEQWIIPPPGSRDPRPQRVVNGICPECGCERTVRVLSGAEFCAECGFQMGGRNG